jgi:serine/threonine protein kinase
MTQMAAGPSGPLLDDPRVLAALEEYLAALEAGTPPDRDAFLARHGALAGTLAVCLDGLNLIRAASPRLQPTGRGDPPEVRGQIGDFRLLREVGRGGMGVVYEAEQLSLNRRVALKVLPFAATLDSRQRQRFLYEAQVAAQLHHPNIVPVYGVGCERGVHYYVMQFVEGQTLAAVIAELRQQRETRSERTPAPGPSTPLAAALSTERSARGVAYFRTVARLGVQAAEALEHAHQAGIVHRDIKPANLILDGAGQLWVADFGLARGRSEQGLTLTGDIVGTLRYMSPEQALAKHGLVDHRGDVYALGVTLYELLTLTPAYPENDREELLQQIALGEPQAPRRLTPALPVELENIVLKAMAREPAGRYATAQDLADDLRRFLENRPIQATRPTVWERLTKWAVRHRTFVGAAGVVLILTTIVLLAGTLLVWHEKTKKEEALTDATTQRDRAEQNFRQALSGVNNLLWELEEPRWADMKGLTELRQAVTEKGLHILQGFIQEGSSDPVLRFQTARTYSLMCSIRGGLHQNDLALEALGRSAALLDELVAEYPDEVEYRKEAFWIHYSLGGWNFSLKRHPVARQQFAEAMALCHPGLAADADGFFHNSLAVVLGSCAEEDVRDPAQAVALARQAVASAPQESAYWQTLGIACCRAGDLDEAVHALNRSLELHDGNPSAWFFLAMTAWQRGNKAEATKWYDQGVRWMKTHPPTSEAHYRYGGEAAALLGRPPPKPPTAK